MSCGKSIWISFKELQYNNSMNKDKFISEYEDIMSSGDQAGMSYWQMEELDVLFKKVGVTSILKDWVEEIFANIEDGVSGEEIKWVANKLGMKATISFG